MCVYTLSPSRTRVRADWTRLGLDWIRHARSRAQLRNVDGGEDERGRETEGWGVPRVTAPNLSSQQRRYSVSHTHGVLLQLTPLATLVATHGVHGLRGAKRKLAHHPSQQTPRYKSEFKQTSSSDEMKANLPASDDERKERETPSLSPPHFPVRCLTGSERGRERVRDPIDLRKVITQFEFRALTTRTSFFPLFLVCFSAFHGSVQVLRRPESAPLLAAAEAGQLCVR